MIFKWINVLIFNLDINSLQQILNIFTNLIIAFKSFSSRYEKPEQKSESNWIKYTEPAVVKSKKQFSKTFNKQFSNSLSQRRQQKFERSIRRETSDFKKIKMLSANQKIIQMILNNQFDDQSDNQNTPPLASTMITKKKSMTRLIGGLTKSPRRRSAKTGISEHMLTEFSM